MAMIKATGSQIIVKLLEAEGIKTVAGIPGGSILPLYDELNRVEEAFADYKMVNQLYPEYYFAYESLGILAWGAGDYAASREGFAKAYEIYPASTSYPLMIAVSYYMEAYEKAGTPEEATLKKAGKDYLSKVALKNLNRTSTEYAIARLFYDNVSPGTVVQKVENEANATYKKTSHSTAETCLDMNVEE